MKCDIHYTYFSTSFRPMPKTSHSFFLRVIRTELATCRSATLTAKIDLHIPRRKMNICKSQKNDKMADWY